MKNPQGGIDAVEIESGKLLWTTKAAAKPLALSSGHLLAQGEPTDRIRFTYFLSTPTTGVSTPQ